MTERDLDATVRMLAFEFLKEQTSLLGEVLPRELLARGFEFEGKYVRLIGPQGIFKPAILPEMPLTITTVPEIEGRERPYEDELGDDGLLRYRYRGNEGDWNHRDNAGLRIAMSRMTPLVFLHGIVPGHYMPIWPVYIVGDDRPSLSFTVDLRLAIGRVVNPGEPSLPEPELQRGYVISQVRRRLHQQRFRVKVVRAYSSSCAICNLGHWELLDAAHILPDGHPRGEPVVPNGISLCKLHHGAFDCNILGIRPDLHVEVRMDILREVDGPMLKHGLQGFQDQKIKVPGAENLKPRRDFLEERYRLFKKTG